MDRDNAISSPVARFSSSMLLRKSSPVTGRASTHRPTAQGMEMTMVLLMDRPIFSLAPSWSAEAISCATTGIMAAAMAMAKAVGILDMVMGCVWNTPQRALRASSSTSFQAGRSFK